MSPQASETGAFHVGDLRGEPETRRYRVKPEDLLASAAVALFDGRPTDGNQVLPPTATIDDLTAGALEDAVRIIRAFVAPESWSGDARCALYVEREEIVVRHVPAVLAQVERLMDTLKANRDIRVRLRVRFLSIDAERLRGIRHLPALRHGLGGIVRRSEIESLLPPPGESRRLTRVPNLTLHHGQTGVVRLGGQFAYIKSYLPKEGGYNPVVDAANVGLELRARAVSNGPGSDRFALEVDVESRDVTTFMPVLLNGYFLQIPRTVVDRIEGSLVLGADEAAVLLAPSVGISSSIRGRLFGDEAELSQVTLVLLEAGRAE